MAGQGDRQVSGSRTPETDIYAPYLTPEHGLQAVYRYAEVYSTPVTNETAEQISRLCMSDPFFISCVIQSDFEGKDLTTPKGVAEAVNYEITDEGSEMSMTWGEYIELTLEKVNDRNAKDLLLHLSRYNDRKWTPRELKKKLGLKISEKKIREKLEIMRKADVISRGPSDIDYRGLRDGTLNLVLRNRFEKEIGNYAPDLKKEFSEELERLKTERDSLRGKLNNLTDKYAEFQLFTEFRSKKRFSLSAYFAGVGDKTKLNITEVCMRYKFQRSDGMEMEIDVLADSDCGRTVLVEVKKTKEKIGIRAVREFHEKTAAYSRRFPKKMILPAFLSVGGFTGGAAKFCRENNIGTAEQIVSSRYFISEKLLISHFKVVFNREICFSFQDTEASCFFSRRLC
ncbi:MAG: restriction endonuclease [Desulfobacteraceae bacterium]|nr:restriction endonuclease [Desulfobacteraceae bacterium]